MGTLVDLVYAMFTESPSVDTTSNSEDKQQNDSQTAADPKTNKIRKANRTHANIDPWLVPQRGRRVPNL